jgi:oligopeptide transport system permease protein
MSKYLVRRLFGAALTLIIILTVSFFMIRAAPGGPFDQERAFPPDVLAELEKKFNLDLPVWQQYLVYMKRLVVQQDLGPSTKFAERSVNELIGDALPTSFKLGLGALLVAVLVGVLAGLIAALHHNRFLDYFPMGIAMVGVSVPDFVLANILILIFSLGLNWLPAAGISEWQGYILPCTTLGLVYAASIARLTRGGLLEILHQDFIRTARAKGLPNRVIIWRHSLKGGLLPVVSYLGPATAGMLTGSIVIEKIFALPGLGKLLIDSSTNRDYTLALGCVIVFAVLIISLNFLVDIAYGLLDPRVSLNS